MHYKALRLVAKDFRKKVNREKLEMICKRAPPGQWAKYAISSLVIKVLRIKRPVELHQILIETLYNERRHQRILVAPMTTFEEKSAGRSLVIR
jgi:hypothetical protein